MGSIESEAGSKMNRCLAIVAKTDVVHVYCVILICHICETTVIKVPQVSVVVDAL